MTEENTVVELDATPVANLETTYANIRAGALVTCTPVDEDSPLSAKPITVDYAEMQAYTGEAPKTVAYKFRATGVVTVEGMETEVVKYAAKADRAVDMVLDAIFKGVKGIDHTSFANDADWEDEWFQSNMKAPPAVTDDVWKMDRFKDMVGDLTAARGEFEQHMEASQGNEVTAQYEAIEAAKVCIPIYDALGRNRKLMASWAAGADGDGANMPLLSKLGKGAHALTELMKLGRLSTAMVRILPVSITSGKGADYHRAKGYAAIASVAATLPNQVTVVDGKAALPTPEQAALILINIAQKGFGVGEDMTVEGQIDDVNAAASAAAVLFTQELGKSVSSWGDKASYDRAVLVYGKVACSDEGEGEFNAAWKLVEAYTTPEEGVAPMTAAEFEKAYLSTSETGNMLLRHAVKAITAHAETVAKEAVVREVLKEVDDVELTPKELKEIKALDTDTFAQHMFRRLQKRMETEGDAEAILKLVGAYAKQSGLFIVEKKDAA